MYRTSTIVINWLTLLLFLFSVSACERRTEVKLDGGNPPTFVMSGSGRLVSLTIFNGEDKPIWKIEKTETLEAVEKLHRITYGVVPNGYKQVEPDNGNLPPHLTPGIVYEY